MNDFVVFRVLWNSNTFTQKPRKKNDCEKARKRGEKDGKYADFSSL